MENARTPTANVPLVSVIIPCYRQAHLLPEAIESCLAQSYPAVEIVVVDDGSDDDTGGVAARYGDRIVYVRRPNGGLPAARNSGIARAGGAYLKFLDADDTIHPDQIRWQMAAMAGRDDRVSLTTVRKYRDGAPDEYEDHVPAARALMPDLFRDIGWGGIHGFLFPAALVEAAGGFDETLRCAEDWDLLTRVGLLDPELVTDDRVGAFYRLYPGSMSTNKPAMADAVSRLLVALHDRLRDGPRRDWFGVDLLGMEQRAYFYLLAYRNGDRERVDGLAARIRELQRAVGVAFPAGGRFARLVALIGYPAAARARLAYYTKVLRIRYS